MEYPKKRKTREAEIALIDETKLLFK